jgi:hypothetical protein
MPGLSGLLNRGDEVERTTLHHTLFPAATAGESLLGDAHDLSHIHGRLQSLFATEKPLAGEQ